ncbi:MAG: hypothetical protein ABGZ35_23155 [Planctomycetaceae bacterium]|jgi:hypothetical protein
MNCTGCQYLDRRNGECRELVAQTICGQCLQVYWIKDIRCPRCLLVSTTPVGALKRDDKDFVASGYCPLTTAERQRLQAKQTALAQPVLTQKELF